MKKGGFKPQGHDLQFSLKNLSSEGHFMIADALRVSKGSFLLAICMIAILAFTHPYEVSLQNIMASWEMSPSSPRY